MDGGAVGSGGATGIAGTSGSGGTTAPGSGGTSGGNQTGGAAGCSCAVASSPSSNYAAGTLFVAVALFGRARRRRRTGRGRISIDAAALGQPRPMKGVSHFLSVLAFGAVLSALTAAYGGSI